jgi:hypothetical protein
MRKWWLPVLLSLSLGSTGCFTVRLKNTQLAPGDAHEQWTDHFLFGLIGHEVVDVRAYCGDRDVAEVTTGSNVITWLLSFVTIGIYSPNIVGIRCASGPMPGTVMP